MLYEFRLRARTYTCAWLAQLLAEGVANVLESMFKTLHKWAALVGKPVPVSIVLPAGGTMWQMGWKGKVEGIERNWEFLVGEG